MLDTHVFAEDFETVQAQVASVLCPESVVVVWNMNHGDQKVLRALITDEVKCVNICPLARRGFKDYQSVSVGYLYWSLFGHDSNWHTALGDARGTMAVVQSMLDKYTLVSETTASPAFETLKPVSQEENSLVKATALRHGSEDRLPRPEKVAAATFVTGVMVGMVEQKGKLSGRIPIVAERSEVLLVEPFENSEDEMLSPALALFTE